MDFRNILVPTDFSEESEAAFEYAASLAKTSGGKIHVLHVIELTVYPINIGLSAAAMEEMKQKQIKDAGEKLGEISRRFTDQGVETDTAVLHGKSDESIVKYAAENNIDVICIGTHGRSGFEHLMIGSTTEKVIRKAKCPVLSAKLDK